MSYAALEEKVRLLPEDCLDEVADYIEFILLRHDRAHAEKSDLSQFFGLLKNKRVGLEMQKVMRNEWN